MATAVAPARRTSKVRAPGSGGGTSSTQRKRMVLSPYETAVLCPPASPLRTTPAAPVRGGRDNDDGHGHDDDDDDDDEEEGKFGVGLTLSATAADVQRSTAKGSVAPPMALLNSEQGSTGSLSEEDLLEARRQFHLACEQSRRRTIKDSLEELKSHIPQCEHLKLTKAVILTKAIGYLQTCKTQRDAMAQEINRLRSELYALQMAASGPAAVHQPLSSAAAAPRPGPLHTHTHAHAPIGGLQPIQPRARTHEGANAATVPPGWECIVTPEGRPLYREVATNVTQWTHPAHGTHASRGRRVHANPGNTTPEPTTRTVLTPTALARLLHLAPPALDVKPPPMVSEAASTATLVPATTSPIDSAHMAIGDVLQADLWPGSAHAVASTLSPFDPAASATDDPAGLRIHVFAPGPSHDRDEGYHTRDPSHSSSVSAVSSVYSLNADDMLT
jgi:hypothetical protein